MLLIPFDFKANSMLLPIANALSIQFLAFPRVFESIPEWFNLNFP
jgi:hypothetical protein